jgi:hypothetical protein
VIKQSIHDVVIENLLATDLQIVSDPNQADIIVQGRITVSDQKSFSVWSGMKWGTYVTSITAKLLMGNEIVGSITETQLRSGADSVDPPEKYAKKFSKNLIRILRK